MSSSIADLSRSGTKKTEAIDDLLQCLEIDDDKIDDLVFEEEESAPKEGIKWMAFMHVHTTNYFSPQSFEQNICIA
jgi:hypothetical protein